MSVVSEEFLCARCARRQKTCCQDTDIFVTLGDVQRIAEHTGRSDFFEFRPASDPVYLKQDDDPTWKKHVFRSDGTRRVVNQQPNGDCVFLGEFGCVLPTETRPLICRLYPFDYTDAGIKPEPARGCPVELLRPEQSLLETLDMRFEEARRWHEQLYREVQLE